MAKKVSKKTGLAQKVRELSAKLTHADIENIISSSEPYCIRNGKKEGKTTIYVGLLEESGLMSNEQLKKYKNLFEKEQLEKAKDVIPFIEGKSINVLLLPRILYSGQTINAYCGIYKLQLEMPQTREGYIPRPIKTLDDRFMKDESREFKKQQLAEEIANR
jgi:hypothetical protein